MLFRSTIIGNVVGEVILIREWFSFGRVIEMDKEGCTVKWRNHNKVYRNGLTRQRIILKKAITIEQRSGVRSGVWIRDRMETYLDFSILRGE